MKVEISSLCEYASERQGHLTIVDTFDVINAMKFPWRAYFYYVAKIDVNDDSLQNYQTITMSIINKDNGDKLFETSNPLNKIHKSDKLNLVAGFKGLIFNKAGEYRLDVYFDKELVINHPFKVVVKKDGK